MNTPTASPASAPPPVIDSRAAFTEALRWGFEQAVQRRARRVLCVDRDFAEWPLDEPALHTLWTDWLRPGQNRLVLLAQHYDEVPRRQPRFVAWRAAWSHAVETWSPAEDAAAAELPTLLVDDGPLSVHLVDAVHWRGRAERDARSARQWRDQLEAVLQRSERAFPVHPLGL